MGMIRIDNNVSIYPMPVVLAGAVVDGQTNFLTVGWISRVNSRPPMFAMALNKTHYTNGGIRERREFSINVPSVALLEKVDYCGLVSGREADKSQLFDIFYGKLRGAPLIRECPLCLACTLVDTVSLPSNDLFIGETAEVYAEESALTPHSRKPCPLGRGESNPRRGIIKGAGSPLYPPAWWPWGVVAYSPYGLASEQPREV